MTLVVPPGPCAGLVPRAIALIVATTSLLACGGRARPTPVPANGVPFSGTWLFTFTQDDGRTTTARLTVAPDGQGGWSAWSREGVAAAMVGRRKAILGRMLGKLPPHGAIVNVVGGRLMRRANDTLLVTGQLRSPITGNRYLAATVAAGRLAGELRWDSTTTTAVAGTVDGAPLAAAELARPLRDYPALSARVRRAFADSLYDPRLVERPEWRAFFAGFDRRLAAAYDDLDAMVAFYALRPRLGISHVEFFRNPSWDGLSMDSLLARYEQDDPASLVRLTWPAPGVAWLRVDRWKQVGPWIDSGFMRIDSARARTLVLDIRANPGGDASAIVPAMHLTRDSQPVGVFVGRKWFQSHDAPPPREAMLGLPRADERRGGLVILAGVREGGVLAGVIGPRAPHFGGEVFVLIDGRSGSASEPLAYHLRVTGRATLVGERTAGAMLTAPPHSVGDGWMLVLPEADFYAADGTRLEGRGVDPHVKATSAEAPLVVARRIHARDPWGGALMLGSAYAGMQRWADAERWYGEAARTAPDSIAPVHGLAQVYVGTERWSEAIAAWERVLAARPGDLGALYQLGRSAALSGTQLERGEAALRAYLERPRRPELPSHVGAHWRLGQILLARGDREGARREFEEALRLDPKNVDARKALEGLK